MCSYSHCKITQKKIGGYLEQMEEQVILKFGSETVTPMQLMSFLTEICFKFCFLSMKYFTFAG